MSADVAPGPVLGAGRVVASGADPLDGLARPARARHPVPWGVVSAMALCLAAADMFHVIGLQGAVGSIERNQSAFALWLRITGLCIPFMVGAVMLALRVARRRVGPELRTVRTLSVAVGLLVLASTAVGLGAAAANAAIDYRLQAKVAEKVAVTMHHGNKANPAVNTGTSRNSASCTGACKAKRDTRAAHYKGLGLLTPVMLGTNVVVVLWVVAMAGGSLDPRRRRNA